MFGAIDTKQKDKSAQHESPLGQDNRVDENVQDTKAAKAEKTETAERLEAEKIEGLRSEDRETSAEATAMSTRETVKVSATEKTVSKERVDTAVKKEAVVEKQEVAAEVLRMTGADEWPVNRSQSWCPPRQGSLIEGVRPTAPLARRTPPLARLQSLLTPPMGRMTERLSVTENTRRSNSALRESICRMRRHLTAPLGIGDQPEGQRQRITEERRPEGRRSSTLKVTPRRVVGRSIGAGAFIGITLTCLYIVILAVYLESTQQVLTGSDLLLYSSYALPLLITLSLLATYKLTFHPSLHLQL